MGKGCPQSRIGSGQRFAGSGPRKVTRGQLCGISNSLDRIAQTSEVTHIISSLLLTTTSSCVSLVRNRVEFGRWSRFVVVIIVVVIVSQSVCIDPIVVATQLSSRRRSQTMVRQPLDSRPTVDHTIDSTRRLLLDLLLRLLLFLLARTANRCSLPQECNKIIRL